MAAEEKLLNSRHPTRRDLSDYLKALTTLYASPPTDLEMVEKLKAAISGTDKNEFVLTKITQLTTQGEANIQSAYILGVPSLSEFGNRQLQLARALKQIVDRGESEKGYLEEAFV